MKTKNLNVKLPAEVIDLAKTKAIEFKMTLREFIGHIIQKANLK